MRRHPCVQCTAVPPHSRGVVDVDVDVDVDERAIARGAPRCERGECQRPKHKAGVKGMAESTMWWVTHRQHLAVARGGAMWTDVAPPPCTHHLQSRTPRTHARMHESEPSASASASASPSAPAQEARRTRNTRRHRQQAVRHAISRRRSECVDAPPPMRAVHRRAAAFERCCGCG